MKSITKYGQECAFPSTVDKGEFIRWHSGLNVRSYIATHIAAGYVASTHSSDVTQEDIADYAVNLADKLINRLETPPKDNKS